MTDDRLFDQLPEVMARIGPDLVVRSQNEAARKHHGEATGKPCHLAHFGRDSRCRGCMVDEVLEHGRVGRWHLSQERGGRQIYYEITVSPVRDADGNVVELIETIRDATIELALQQQLIENSEELEAEAAKKGEELVDLTRRAETLRRELGELRQDQAALVQTEKMASLGRLAAGLTHEIHTPLGALISNLDLLRRTLERLGAADADEATRRQVEASGQLLDLQQLAADRIHGIVKSLRLFAHLDRAEEEDYDVHEGIEASLALLRHRTKDGIDVVRAFGKLPRIRCRPDALNQVFMNLLQNAVDAIEGRGRLSITTRVQGDEVELEFRDTGRGIDPEHLGRLFEPGFTTKPRGVGTGLGLAIAYRTIAAHSGTISVDSRPGQGTAFTVRLPIGNIT